MALATVLIAMLAVFNLAALALGAYALAPLVGGLNPPILSAGIGAAILRYRLYDLDRIISRTLAWLLTLVLGGGYAAVAWSSASCWAGTPAWPWPGPPWPWRSAQPARRRIQQAVDRRFQPTSPRRGPDHHRVQRPAASAG